MPRRGAGNPPPAPRLGTDGSLWNGLRSQGTSHEAGDQTVLSLRGLYFQ